jgi:hypothetical protein
MKLGLKENARDFAFSLEKGCFKSFSSAVPEPLRQAPK